MAEEAALNQETGNTAEAASERSLSLLAAERFGPQYKGEVREPEKREPEAEPEQELPEAPEASEESPEHEDAEREAPEEEAETEVQSFAELVESQGWDVEWASSLKVPIKVDGKESFATISDLVKSHQMGEAADRRLEDAKAKTKEVNTLVQQKTEQLQAQFASVGALIQNAEAMLSTDISSVNWDSLRQDDPAEYTAKKLEAQERRQSIENLKAQAAKNWQEAMQSQAQESESDRVARLQAEQGQLLAKLPEWEDAKKAQEDQTKLVGYLTGQGFDESDVMGASDHRLIVLAHKARLYDESVGRGDAAKKKVSKVPRMLKPGTPKSPEQTSKAQADQARNRLRQSGRIEDAFALLKQTRRS